MQVSDGNAKLLPLAEALLKKHVESHSLQELEGTHCVFHLFAVDVHLRPFN